ncbi:MAG: DNA cytosine methyltransferase [Clostridia bacterium]|nr:DNA cytosine methyltransferase [Clostridia bacterium]
MKKLKVLVACEESQRVCTAFRERGHEAFSCDIIKPSGGHPEWHILGNALSVLNPTGYTNSISFRTMDGNEYFVKKWDLIIAHPPCTYLSNAGACRLYPKKRQLNIERYKQGLEAKEFFMEFLNADCEHIAVENPIPTRVFGLPKYTQIIQPYEYGHPYTKKTCLWLKGLPKLQPTDIVEPIGPYVCGNSEIWKKQAANGKVIGKEKSAKHRSKTFQGIAKAMAEQWSKYLCGIPENT